MHEESFWGNPRTWVGLAFVMFVVFFGRRLWAALAAMLDARTAAIQASLDEANRLRVEAEQLLRDAETRRTTAIAEAQLLLDGAKAEAGRLAATARADAEQAARRREQMAVDRIAAAEKAAVDDVRLTAADVATTAARDVLLQVVTPDADAALIDHAIGQLPSALSARRAA